MMIAFIPFFRAISTRMVAGMWLHMKSLRKMKTGYGPDIREMLAEAENERMHLMFFIERSMILTERRMKLIDNLKNWIENLMKQN